MSQDLREIQKQAGGIFATDATVPVSFGNDAESLKAAKNGVAVCDRSHWGLIQVADEDRLQFLHNQSTNDIKRLRPGQGCNTVFVNSTARTLDLATAYVTESEVLLLVSPGQGEPIIQWLDRYLFPMDRVKLADLSEENVVFSLMGTQSDRLLKSLGVESIIAQPEFTHQLVNVADISVRIAVGNELALPGYTLIVAKTAAAALWQKLTQAGAVPLGDRAWESLRIQQGRPVPGRELTEDYNPLEAGLWKAISFEKGCYIGQETIARLNTYQGVKQRLWGVQLSAPVDPETPVIVDEKKVGKLTSYTDTESGPFGLAYVRSQAGGAGLNVRVAEAEGELVAVPFLTHEYYQPQVKA